MIKLNRRPLPEAAVNDPNSVEMLTVWIAEGELHCSIKIGMYTSMGMNEVAAWGRILADTARHIGNALEEKQGLDAREAVLRISRSFYDELALPTTSAQGKFIKKN
ncbi:DUF5076 domain-containing protein [Stenotrophomonas sp.]|uniref:DUF5076 domain-containing protein n=1 Tax=Stenotrophomonas sp. TaxID=69392 RepID=UPI0028A6C0D4|nr:DUF5076 domain-containing protein [Stenotrophomonas sp.]